jgi:hypothetical protein
MVDDVKDHTCCHCSLALLELLVGGQLYGEGCMLFTMGYLPPTLHPRAPFFPKHLVQVLFVR